MRNVWLAHVVQKVYNTTVFGPWLREVVMLTFLSQSLGDGPSLIPATCALTVVAFSQKDFGVCVVKRFVDQTPEAVHILHPGSTLRRGRASLVPRPLPRAGRGWEREPGTFVTCVTSRVDKI